MAKKSNKWEKLAAEADVKEQGTNSAAAATGQHAQSSSGATKPAAAKAKQTAASADKPNTGRAKQSASAAVEGVDDEREQLDDELAEMFADAAVQDPKSIALEAKVEQLNAKLLKQAADHRNSVERGEREMRKARLFANQALINKLLPVMDSLVRGLEVPETTSGQTDAAAQGLRAGMQMTCDLLQKTLEEFGVSIINPKAGEVFDPEQHEAMTVQHNAEQADNSIIQVLQQGYKLQDRILRAAMVIVNRVE